MQIALQGLPLRSVFLIIGAFVLVQSGFQWWNENQVFRNYKTTEQILAMGKTHPQMQDLYGTWAVHTPQDPGHAVATVICEEKNVTDFDSSELHKLGQMGLGKCVCDSDYVYQSSVVGAVHLKVEDVRWRRKYSWISSMLYLGNQKVLYKLILHKNGVIRFLPPGNSKILFLARAYMDSKSWWDLYENLKHAHQYGCFCLGILTEKGRIVRYNRWRNKYPDYFYTACKVEELEN